MAEVLAPSLHGFNVATCFWPSWRNLRQKGDDEYKRCFIERVPKQASFAAATRQAQKLLSATLNAR